MISQLKQKIQRLFPLRRKPSNPTICTECAHFINLDFDSARRDVWYNHVCGASPLPRKPDPYNGKMKPYNKNDLGQVYFSESDYEFCRKINDGNCRKFQSIRDMEN